ncbi:MAG: bifunctional helix-turn-helix transcriptional regulator/GNAT family N-acetyltransferase [Thermoanaerobaculia bacterium]|nr:bifunctional helix-turn-helix transcriptional regulator/GNAT family N-acetyltransferase [Thermoanaerobaculia bacterium]
MADVQPVSADLSSEVTAMRRFNRFYTQRIGLVSEKLLDGPLSLPEARVLQELLRRDVSVAGDVIETLGIDRGQLSRTLRKLDQRGLIERRRSEQDGRRWILAVTQAGKELHDALNVQADRLVGATLQDLSTGERQRLIRAMEAIESVLAGELAADAPCVLRGPGSGDLGYVVQRHGELYAREQGFDQIFEGVVASILGRFGQDHDPHRERMWIAEIGGRTMGTIALVREDDRTARLRLFLVEPQARGRGVGTLLIEELLRFAGVAGYERIVLSTVSRLEGARRLYERYGFQLAHRSAATRRWSQDVVDEEWRLDLKGAAAA